jgi:signal transduction histidine kinase
MHLQTKANIYFTTTAFLVLLISGSIVYFLLQYIIRDEVDERLLDQKNRIEQKVWSQGDFGDGTVSMDSSIRIGPKLDSSAGLKTSFADTAFFNRMEGELVPYRSIRFPVRLNSEVRMVTIYQSLIGREELIEAISFSFFVVLVVMIAALTAVNFLSTRRLWSPFRQILGEIKTFDFHKRHSFALIPTDITEFRELNDALSKMAEKLTSDYFALKEFSENASHEMQTPLAIIRSKLELLLQQKNLNDETVQALVSAHKATGRLSRLHHDLNLLNRIENNEFTDKKPVNLKSLLEDQIENFSDLIEMKDIQIQAALTGEPVVMGSQYLLDILFSNLLGNAIKHNIPKGRIEVGLSDSEFKISNTGSVSDYPPEKMFERFRKGKTSSDSTGLGLAIVQQICILHLFEIRYYLQDNIHIFKIHL